MKLEKPTFGERQEKEQQQQQKQELLFTNVITWLVYRLHTNNICLLRFLPLVVTLFSSRNFFAVKEINSEDISQINPCRHIRPFFAI